MRELAILLSLTIAGGALADPALGLPDEPSPSPAEYVSPLELLEGSPLGSIRIEGDDICLDPVAAARSVAIQKAAPKLSDIRALASWRKGWSSGVRASLPALEKERGKRLAAEALAAAGDDEGSTTLLASVASASVALALGVILGAYLVDK